MGPGQVISIWLILWLFLSSPEHRTPPDVRSPPTDTLIIRGLIGQDTYAKVKVFEGRKIVIDSLGGDHVWGVRIADLISRRPIAVYVNDRCLSACFTHVFLPAERRILGENAIIGMHVVPLMLQQVANAEGKTLPEWTHALAVFHQQALQRRGVSMSLFREAARRLEVGLLDPPLSCRTDGFPMQDSASRAPCQRHTQKFEGWYLETEQLRMAGIEVEGWNIEYHALRDIPHGRVGGLRRQPAIFGNCVHDPAASVPWTCRREGGWPAE